MHVEREHSTTERKKQKKQKKQKKEQKTKQNISKVQRNDLKTFTKTFTKQKLKRWHEQHKKQTSLRSAS